MLTKRRSIESKPFLNYSVAKCFYGLGFKIVSPVPNLWPFGLLRPLILSTISLFYLPPLYQLDLAACQSTHNTESQRIQTLRSDYLEPSSTVPPPILI